MLILPRSRLGRVSPHTLGSSFAWAPNRLPQTPCDLWDYLNEGGEADEADRGDDGGADGVAREEVGGLEPELGAADGDDLGGGRLPALCDAKGGKSFN